MDQEILIVKNLNAFCPSSLGKGAQRILDNVSIILSENDILGLVGETGAGKSVLIDAIGRNLKPPLWFEAETLSVNLDGRMENLLDKNEEQMAKIWGKGIAFIPPNARDRLNPLLTIGEQFSNIICAHSRLSPKEARDKAIETFRLVQMPDAERNLDSYPHELSGGMAQRVVISIALFMLPKVLLADEPTMGLDVTIQKQVLDLMARLLVDLQSSAIIATRDLGIVANYCKRVAVMCNGQVVELAPVREFFKNAVHPYSHYLLEAAFASHGMTARIDSKKVATRSEMEMRSENSCRFAGRCAHAEEMKDLCWSVNPPETFLNPDHFVRCHRISEGK
ncbi:MAG: ABC transporter ATP-binding protein [Deltaproteobacteria bacterium]|nr:ABC transporter ATP-binding protein [Deltaproteobacteria bacterium]